jgi:hypothetical protein
MIYFKIIFNVIQANIFKFSFFLAFSFLAIIGFEKREDILKEYMLFSSELPQMSFVTDELGKSVEIKNKLMILPGVKSVRVEKSNQLQEKLKNLFKDEGFQEIINESDIKYVKYTLTYESMITDKSIKLIKSFIIKILPEKDVVFSSVKGVKNKGENQKVKKSKFMIFYTTFGLLCLLIVFLHHGIMLELKRFSYLYQRFQRKKYVTIKASLLLSSMCIFTFIVLSYSLASSLMIVPTVALGAFLVSMTFLLNFKEHEWK